MKSVGEKGLPAGELRRFVEFTGTQNTCLPTILHEDNKLANKTRQSHLEVSGKESGTAGSIFGSQCIYIDSNISSELQKKVFNGSPKAIIAHHDI